MAIKFIVKPVSSFGVFAHEDGSDGRYSSDRSVGTYESETTAQCVAEALNEEAGRDLGPLQGLGWSVEERQQIAGAKQFPPIAGDGNASAFPNGHDKETI